MENVLNLRTTTTDITWGKDGVATGPMNSELAAGTIEIMVNMVLWNPKSIISDPYNVQDSKLLHVTNFCMKQKEA